MNPINVIILVSILFGASIANSETLLDSLSESYSITGTAEFVADYSGTEMTLIYPHWCMDIDLDRQLIFIYGDYTFNGTAVNNIYLASLVDGYSWESISGVCTRTSFIGDNFLGGWSSYVVTTENSRAFTATSYGITTTFTLGNDGIPASITTSATTPFPYTLSITIASHNDMVPSFSVFHLPQECVALGFACTACYNSDMMESSCVL